LGRADERDGHVPAAASPCTACMRSQGVGAMPCPGTANRRTAGG
jgi:hypothetical protein